jgi:hypothetical protein
MKRSERVGAGGGEMLLTCVRVKSSEVGSGEVFGVELDVWWPKRDAEKAMMRM